MKTSKKIRVAEISEIGFGFLVSTIELLNIENYNIMSLSIIGILMIIFGLSSYFYRMVKTQALINRFDEFRDRNRFLSDYKKLLHANFTTSELCKLIEIGKLHFSELEYQSPYVH